MDGNERSRPKTFHIYTRHDNATFLLAEDGCYVPELDKAREFSSFDEASSVLEALIGGRDLGKDEPGIIVDAWKWLPK